MASWTATATARDDSRTDIGNLTRRNLVWAIIPAAVSPFLLGVVSRNIFGVFAILLYTALVATFLTVRYRTSESTTWRLRVTASWVGGTIAATVAIIAVAGLFGLTGA